MTDEPRSTNSEAGFAALLKRLRTAAGLTQEELAERASLSARGISDLERGLKRHPHRETVRLLTAALNLSPEDAAAFLAASTPAEELQFEALPAPASSLFGRDEAVREAAAVLRNGETRLMTLIGPGGVGKTRLSLAVAAEARDDFAAGAAFVSLASVTSADLAPGTIARALGLRQTAGRPARETLFAELRSRHAMIVLDNCEQAPIGELVGELLRRCPKLVFLATSRAPLRVTGEREQPVVPLDLPNPAKLPPLDALARNPAVALFVARAAAARPDFTLTARNASAVATICAKLDGLPLAIELAAARIKLLTPAALLELLSDRFRLLTGGPHDAPERHQTMRAAIAWSEGLLTERERRAFRGLAAFRGGCRLEDALAVLTPDDAVAGLDDLTGLVDQSLLRRDDAGDDEPRLFMLETIREFASEQLDASNEGVETRGLHADCFLNLAEYAKAMMDGPDVYRWLNRLETEHDNLWAAFKWLLAGRDADRSLRLSGSLWHFWWQRGRLREGRMWLQQAIDVADDGFSAALDSALEMLGNIQSDLCDYGAARASYERCLALRRQLGDRQGISSVLHNLGIVLGYLGAYQRARELIEESLGFSDAPSVPDRRRAFSLQALGDIAFCEGRYETSLKYLEENRDIVRRVGNQPSIAYASYFLGRTTCQFVVDQGRRLLESSLEFFRANDDLLGAAYALATLGQVNLTDHRINEARALSSEGLIFAANLGSIHCMVICCENLAAAFAKQASWAVAARFLGAAEQGRLQISRPPTIVEQIILDDVNVAGLIAVGATEWREMIAVGHAIPIVDLADAQEVASANFETSSIGLANAQ